ncbi:MAG TPA: AraC family transcriptional regulator [Xanthobacteraceae bacterium]|nr:AraC family transcriptional regulator [Xanthobacteraceae bacterium]
MSNALRITYGRFGRVALLDMDRSLVQHAHPHCHVLLKVDGADTQFAVGDRWVKLTDTQAVLINAWEPHAYVHDSKRPRTTILALYIEPDWLTTFRTNWNASAAFQLFRHGGGELSPRIRSLTMSLADLMVTQPEAVAKQEEMIADLMIAVIERFTAWRETASVREMAAERGGMDWRIRRAIDLLRKGTGKPIDLDGVAREAGLSRAHFYRLFQQSTNMTPSIYQNMLRMELAVKSVVDSQDKLAMVSGMLGFTAPGHFSRFFHNHAGSTPTEFRAVAKLGASRFEKRLRPAPPSNFETHW